MVSVPTSDAAVSSRAEVCDVALKCPRQIIRMSWADSLVGSLALTLLPAPSKGPRLRLTTSAGGVFVQIQNRDRHQKRGRRLPHYLKGLLGIKLERPPPSRLSHDEDLDHTSRS